MARSTLALTATPQRRRIIETIPPDDPSYPEEVRFENIFYVAAKPKIWEVVYVEKTQDGAGLVRG